jgi:cell division protein FtsI/penicillin-binding protein 2
VTASPPKTEQLRKDRWVCMRIFTVTTMLVLGFTGITWRLVHLHVKQHTQLSHLAAQMRQVRQPLPAHRGSIRDRDGELLAHDQSVYELHTDSVHLKEIHLVSRRLAALKKLPVAELRRTQTNEDILKTYRQHLADTLSQPLKMPAETVLAMLETKKPEMVLCKGISDEDFNSWKRILDHEQIVGVYLRAGTQRAYPAKDRLTHVLGDVTFSNTGNWGVEALMDEALSGQNGEQWVELDNKGRELPLYRGKVVEPQHGQDVYLTIDMHLQDYVEGVLEQQCKIYTPKKAIVVLTDPNTGAILAMASRPHYERDAKTGMWRNLAISDPYEPGSTFKLVGLCAALDMGKVRLDTPIFCNNGLYEDPVGKFKLKDDESIGTVSVEDVLVHSSNIGIYKIARQVGQDDFLSYAWRFGFGQKTGIGLKGENAGYLNIDNWTNTTFSRMAMGYEVSVTPIQLAMAIGAIANGGVLMKPSIVNYVASSDGSSSQAVATSPRHQVCKARTAALIKQALVRVVTHGTGKQAAIPGVTVAGKTGTSQRYNEDKRCYEEGHYNTSFVGFAPAENPKVACVVLMDDPKAGRSELYGGKVAAPIFAEIVCEALDHLSVEQIRPAHVRLADRGGIDP